MVKKLLRRLKRRRMERQLRRYIKLLNKYKSDPFHYHSFDITLLECKIDILHLEFLNMKFEYMKEIAKSINKQYDE